MRQQSSSLLTSPPSELTRMQPSGIIITSVIATQHPSMKLRHAVLVWLTLQNSVHNVLMRYARSRPVEHMFLASTAVIFTELIKLGLCLLAVFSQHGSRTGSTVFKTVLARPYDTLKVGLLAFVFILQNNLNYLGATHLQVGVFMVTTQLKIFTTVIFAIIIMRQHINCTQWISLFVLVVGVCMVQVDGITLEDLTRTPRNDGSQQPVIGLLAVISSSILSGFGTVYFERILKSLNPVTVWLRNIQLATCAIPLAFMSASFYDAESHEKLGWMTGFDTIVWFLVTWLAIGGLSVAVVIKHADNISKNFATSVAIIFSTAASVYLTDFVVTTHFVAGATLVIVATCMYAMGARHNDQVPVLPLYTNGREHQM